MTFANRTKAGQQLAEKLNHLFQQSGLDEKANLIVVGLPRGGVPVALEVARKFGCPLDIIVSKKLPFPGQPEFAIGAVSSDGVVELNSDLPQDQEWKSYIEEQRQLLLSRTKLIEGQFYQLARCKASSFKDKVVIVVDDGVATGMTAIAAIETARRRGARRTIMAAPVMSSDSYRKLRSHCDDVVAINVPEGFRSVGQYYLDFTQTSDEEVVRALSESSQFAMPSDSGRQQPGVSPTAYRNYF
jgi:predicted phosphoribosyltransferase